jgi:hypothetical protein
MRKAYKLRQSKNQIEKRLRVCLIDNAGYSVIVCSPQREGGRGSSPMNPRNWQTESGEPIYDEGGAV